jgi:hypothetical protein
MNRKWTMTDRGSKAGALRRPWLPAYARPAASGGTSHDREVDDDGPGFESRSFTAAVVARLRQTRRERWYVA